MKVKRDDFGYYYPVNGYFDTYCCNGKWFESRGQISRVGLRISVHDIVRRDSVDIGSAMSKCKRNVVSKKFLLLKRG